MYNELQSRSSYKTWTMWLHPFVAEPPDPQKVHARFNPPASGGKTADSDGSERGELRRRSEERLTGEEEQRKLAGRRRETTEEERRRCPQPETRRTAATEIEKGCQLYVFTPRCNCRGEKAKKMSSCWWQRDPHTHTFTEERTKRHFGRLLSRDVGGHVARWRWQMDGWEKDGNWGTVWRGRRSNFYSSADAAAWTRLRCLIQRVNG